MTIGLGFFCDDGWIFLLSDRQIGTDQFKFYERKISLIGLATGVVGYTYAGRSDINCSVFEEFGQRIRHTRKTVAEIKQDLQETLDLVLTAESLTFEMLVGVDSDRPALFKTFDKTISPVYKHDFIGCGNSSLVRFLTATLLKGTPEIRRYEALLSGAYTLAQAKKYVQYCGGPTDIVGLFWGEAYEVPRTVCDAVETQFDSLEFGASTAMISLARNAISEQQIQEAAGELAKHIRELQGQLAAIKPHT